MMVKNKIGVIDTQVLTVTKQDLASLIDDVRFKLL